MIEREFEELLEERMRMGLIPCAMLLGSGVVVGVCLGILMF